MAVLDLNPDLVPTSVLAIKCDVADDVSVRTAVEQVARELGGIDVVVKNAGIGAHGTVADNDDTKWHRASDINVVGAARVSRAALLYLRQSPAVTIVNTCSIAATAGLPARALYAATKGAVRALTFSMAADHVREGIRID